MSQIFRLVGYLVEVFVISVNALLRLVETVGVRDVGSRGSSLGNPKIAGKVLGAAHVGRVARNVAVVRVWPASASGGASNLHRS